MLVLRAHLYLKINVYDVMLWKVVSTSLFGFSCRQPVQTGKPIYILTCRWVAMSAGPTHIALGLCTLIFHVCVINLTIAFPGELFTNSFLVKFRTDVDNSLAHHVADRNGFINFGPVSFHNLLITTRTFIYSSFILTYNMLHFFSVISSALLHLKFCLCYYEVNNNQCLFFFLKIWLFHS